MTKNLFYLKISGHCFKYTLKKLSLWHEEFRLQSVVFCSLVSTSQRIGFTVRRRGEDVIRRRLFGSLRLRSGTLSSQRRRRRLLSSFLAPAWWSWRQVWAQLGPFRSATFLPSFTNYYLCQCFGSGWIRVFSPIRIRVLKVRIRPLINVWDLNDVLW